MMERPFQYAVQAKIAQTSTREAAMFFTKTLEEAKSDLLHILDAT